MLLIIRLFKKMCFQTLSNEKWKFVMLFLLTVEFASGMSYVLN